jgi:hypothetical protein
MKGGDKMNGSVLKSIMVLNGDTIGSLAEYLGISPQSVSYKINEKVIHKKKIEFKQGEIAMIKERYNLSAEQVEEIFFS